MKRLFISLTLLTCNLFVIAGGDTNSFVMIAKQEDEKTSALITIAKSGDLTTLSSFITEKKPDSWAIDRAFKEAFQARESLSLQSLQAYITALESEQIEPLRVSCQAALKAAQLSHVLEALFKNSTTTSQVFEDACRSGNNAMIRFFLKHDYSKDFRSSLVNHKHIIVARDAGHRKIALAIQKHLIAKGYGYAGIVNI